MHSRRMAFAASLSAVCLYGQILRQVTPATVVIETSAGATVQLDSGPSQTVPSNGILVLHDVMPGSHVLSVNLDGKQPFHTSVIAAAGGTTQVRAILRDRTGNLELFTAPGAVVWIDGKSFGKADAAGRLQLENVLSGKREIRISAEGYVEGRETVMILPNETITMTARLEPAVRPRVLHQPFQEFTPVRGLLGFQGSGEVVTVSFSEDGKWVAAADNEAPSQVFVWETATGRDLIVNRFEQHIQDAVLGLVISPDGSLIVTSHGSRYTGEMSKVRIWQVTDLKPVHTVPIEKGACASASFTRDGKRLAVGTGPHTVTIFETSRWTALAKSEGGACPSFSPDGKFIATADSSVQIWDSNTGQLIRKMSPAERNAAFWGKPTISEDGKWIVAATRAGVQAWELATGTKAVHFGQPGQEQRSYALSRDGRFIVTISYTDTVVWDFASGASLQSLGIPGEAVALSPNGEWLAIATEVKDGVGLRLFRASVK